MNTLVTQWAQRHGVSPRAIAELGALLKGLDVDLAEVLEGASESRVQSLIRLEAANKGIRLWRNNVGAGKTEAGTFVRYGLANDSAAVNMRLKSADLIGIRPVLIQPEHVGHVIGQFVSREVKRGGWVYSGTDREVAQANWAALVNSMGGDARFAAGEGTL
jgi:hypothetical protein